MNNFLNKYFGLVCPRQKWLSPNDSNPSEIIQGSLVGPISGGLLPIQGPQEGSEAVFWPYFGILNNCKRLPSHTGQEQACSRITWLFGWLFVTMPKMAEFTENSC